MAIQVLAPRISEKTEQTIEQKIRYPVKVVDISRDRNSHKMFRLLLIYYRKHKKYVYVLAQVNDKTGVVIFTNPQDPFTPYVSYTKTDQGKFEAHYNYSGFNWNEIFQVIKDECPK